jgi:hypothetical protein
MTKVIVRRFDCPYCGSSRWWAPLGSSILGDTDIKVEARGPIVKMQILRPDGTLLAQTVHRCSVLEASTEKRDTTGTSRDS